ncbi:MAG: tetratricopeptide repeat protein [Pseudomonadales bacterium]|jgi:predicted O-linked N-acetylglucosamine transferase (SPINDLY family)|nr:tetratricopeptide repeat protein [Pseudomonadales bacterium]
MQNRTHQAKAPNAAAVLYTESVAAYQKGDYRTAQARCQALLATQPNHARAWHLLGICCMTTQHYVEAEGYIRRALALQHDAESYTNLGITLVQLKRADEAIAAYRASLALNPNNAKSCSNLANLLHRRWERQEAEALYRQAIALEPNYATALANLATLLVNRRAYAEAEALLRRCLALAPSHLNAARTLATLLEKSERSVEAALFHERGRQWGALGANLRKRAAWQHLAAVDAAHIADLEAEHNTPEGPWPLLNIPALTPMLLKQASRLFAEEECGEALALAPLVNAAPAHQGPLKIGYLSADFYDHATMHLLAGVLEAHDPAKVDVHLLSITASSTKDSNRYAPRLSALAAAWHDLSADTDAQASARIAAIAPHLLIDLKGYTTDARPNILARRPAALIVSWLGYPGTLGHERLADYLIGDPVVTPLEHTAHFSETLALLPHCYQPNDRSRPRQPPPSRSDAGLPETGLVFCCFNQFIKINPSTFDLWCRLLAAIPGSVLWLLDPQIDGEEAKANLKREAEQRGIASDRLIFAARKPQAAHLARLQLADLALDTFPCNSHTTASDALWAGVPLVTRIGDTFASRVAASLLTTHGCADLVVATDAAYFKLVLALARAPEKLQALRERLAAARLNTPLFDTTRFTRDLERLYENIWQQREVPRHERRPIVLRPGGLA